MCTITDPFSDESEEQNKRNQPKTHKEQSQKN